jgi:hypothetical protein
MTLPDKQNIIQKPPFKVFRETNKINSKQTIKKKFPTTTTTTAQPQHKKDFCRKKICITGSRRMCDSNQQPVSVCEMISNYCRSAAPVGRQE